MFTTLIEVYDERKKRGKPIDRQLVKSKLNEIKLISEAEKRKREEENKKRRKAGKRFEKAGNMMIGMFLAIKHIKFTKELNKSTIEIYLDRVEKDMKKIVINGKQIFRDLMPKIFEYVGEYYEPKHLQVNLNK